MHIVVLGDGRVRTRRHGVPVLAIFVKVEVFTPFDQVVHLVIKLLIVYLSELVVIKGVLIERFQLLLEPLGLDSSLIDGVPLLCNQLSILGVSVELA